MPDMNTIHTFLGEGDILSCLNAGFLIVLEKTYLEETMLLLMMI